MVYLVGGICVINIILWIVFFVKFGRRFSTQKIIEQTRIEMNELVKDMQRNTSNNIDLLNGTIDRIRQLNAEADRKINQLNKKLEVINSEIATKKGTEKLHNAVQKKIVKNPYTDSKAAMAARSYKVNKSPQGDLFEEEPLEIKDEVVVTQDGAAYREVPVISTKVLEEEEAKKVSKKQKSKSINDKVMDLYNAGNSIDEIAAELSVSTTEVQFIIDVS